MHSMGSVVRSTTSIVGAFDRRVGRVTSCGPRACPAQASEWRIVHRVGGVDDTRAADAAVRLRDRAPELADVPVERLVDDYLGAAEAHDLAVLTADAVAGAAAAVLRRGRTRPPGGRIVSVANPTRAHDGWESPHTVVDVVTADAPFLVDSVSAALVRHGYDIHLLFHPLLDVDGIGPSS